MHHHVKQYRVFYISFALVVGMLASIYPYNRYLEREDAARYAALENDRQQAHAAKQTNREDVNKQVILNLVLPPVELTEEEQGEVYPVCTELMITRHELQSADCATALSLISCTDADAVRIAAQQEEAFTKQVAELGISRPLFTPKIHAELEEMATQIVCAPKPAAVGTNNLPAPEPLAQLTGDNLVRAKEAFLLFSKVYRSKKTDEELKEQVASVFTQEIDKRVRDIEAFRKKAPNSNFVAQRFEPVKEAKDALTFKVVGAYNFTQNARSHVVDFTLIISINKQDTSKITNYHFQ